MTATLPHPAAGNGRPDASGPLSHDELRLLDAYWRAANYLSVGQISSQSTDNPVLLRRLELLGDFAYLRMLAGSP